MKVKYFAYIRDYTGTKEIQIEHCDTLYELLIKLCKKHGARFESKIFKDSFLSSEIIILVNGRNIVHLQGLDTFLSPEDEISIFPIVAGG
ncbi:ubiquitin-like small modifier protein 1 [Lutispora saccharofermentans]|uniref:MoaD/ThiS family protein n=1 Tax=Lutispora saccharofermentans TaxID=3024236 RepID=A0ABT1NGB7_9FIRM|nr:ubiquitin-like small modifier protein 1 [Lutispora saccharofermentans]MCQ1530201.1 MoaD/ThiS family protein [Lutispora saccharofermentans]